MKTFISNIIPKLIKYSEIKDIELTFANHPWNLYNDSGDNIVYIFRNKNKELLISINGIISKGSWDLIDQNNMLIETINGDYLFSIGFFENDIAVLSLSGTNEYAFLYNERIINLLSLSISDIEKHIEDKVLIGRNTKYETTIKTTRGSFIKPNQSIKEAFCLGCRVIDSTVNLYYSSETESYYHYDCLKKYIID